MYPGPWIRDQDFKLDIKCFTSKAKGLYIFYLSIWVKYLDCSHWIPHTQLAQGACRTEMNWVNNLSLNCLPSCFSIIEVREFIVTVTVYIHVAFCITPKRKWLVIAAHVFTLWFFPGSHNFTALNYIWMCTFHANLSSITIQTLWTVTRICFGDFCNWFPGSSRVKLNKITYSYSSVKIIAAWVLEIRVFGVLDRLNQQIVGRQCERKT